jgi:DNA-binding NarL/FixJ family response regulator
MRPRIILADDHVLIMEGLRRIVQEASCDLLTTVADGRGLVQAAAELKPDLIILDIGMPLLNGIEAVRQIRQQDSHVKIIFLSMHSDANYVREAFQVGAAGYVLKRSALSELGVAISEVLEGRQYLSPLVTKDSVAAFLANNASPGFGRELTARQREVLQLIAEGKQRKEIAAALNISPKTVEFHKIGIMDALGVRTTAELTRYALEHGISSK